MTFRHVRGASAVSGRVLCRALVAVVLQRPRWVWGDRRIDVLSPTAAVMTATYTIPHFAPTGEPHTVGGAWTAVFRKRHGRWVIIQEHLSSGRQTMPPMN